MNKLLFIHSAEKVKRTTDNLYYTDGSYDNEVWNRYLNFFHKDITFIATLDPKKYEDNYIKDKYNYVPSDVKVITLENMTTSIKKYISFKIRNNRRRIIEEQVRLASALIIRVPCGAAKIAIKYARKHDKPYILEVVGCTWDALWNYGIKGKILAPFSYYIMKGIVKKSKYSIYVTSEFLQKRYPTYGKKTNCSNVILQSIIRSNTKKIKKRNEEEKIILGTSAAIDVKYKGQENVIKALPYLIRDGYNIEYQLIGNGNRERLENIADKYGVKNNVKFIGSIPHDKVFKWLEDIDIYIQPSKQEGLPRALIEAMSKACPAIGTDVAGIPELLSEECIYKKNSIKQLRKLIEKFIDDETFMKQESYKNFEKSKEYDILKINERRTIFYNNFKQENNLF